MTSRGGVGVESVRAKQAHYERFCASHPLKTADVLDATWRYIDSGAGARTLLMIHGLAGEATGFYRMIESFQGEYRAIVPTFPALNTMDGVCRGCKGLLDEAGVGPVVLFGASWGGMVAQAFLHRYPERVEAVILADTSGPNPASARRNAQQSRVLGFVPWWLARRLFQVGIKRLLKVPGELTEEQETELRFQRSRLDVRLADLSKELLFAQSRAAYDLLNDVSYTAEDFRAWPGKMLVLQSADDPGLRRGEDTYALDTHYPGAKVITMHGAGHLGLVLRHDDYVREINSFLVGLPKPDRDLQRPQSLA